MAPRKAKAMLNDADGVPLLGTLATYTLPDDPRKATDLVRAWANNGLDPDALPDQRTGAHIFMSACRSVETRKGHAKGRANRIEIKVDEVLHTEDECVYQVTRLVRDPANRVIEHPKAMTLVYDKKLDRIDVRELEDYEALRGVETAIRKDFEKNRKTVPGQKIRNAIRDTVLQVGGQNLRRKAGGLYFVPDEFPKQGAGLVPTMPVLEGLKGALAELYGDRADFYMIPLANAEDQRDMVAKHFGINAKAQAEELLERALNRVRQGQGTRALRQEMVDKLWNDRRKLSGAIDQFDKLVGLERAELDKDISDLDNAIAQLEELTA